MSPQKNNSIKFLKSLFALVIYAASNVAVIAEDAPKTSELQSQDIQAESTNQPTTTPPSPPSPENSATINLASTGEVPILSPNQKLVSIKNEFYESIKVVLEAADAEIKSKEIYLNPYQVRNDITLSKNINYKIKIYDIYDKYMGYLINTDTKNANMISVSPFLLVQDAGNKKPLPVILAAKNTTTNNSSAETITENSTNIPTPKEIKNPNTPNLATEANSKINESSTNNEVEADGFRRIKIANISNADYHVEIFDSEGKSIGKGWEISNESYLPEFLDLDYNTFLVRADYRLVLTNKKDKEEVIQKPIKELNVDEKGNYVWFIDDNKESE